ncbi:LAMI_0C11254g1_1 [Lachancea mirantina]|uniref:LAMI_0C11254g1_1 n=1 Tax=Lachancea mirantina TaxID=1230905 RepID=A0A1G4J6P7_9SACH|nr:LAMI_0C11254g1_1 [Lachancea mirantina]
MSDFQKQFLAVNMNFQSKQDDQKRQIREATEEFSDSSSEKTSLNNPFLNSDVANHYRQLYDSCGYEGRSVFDPEFEWTPDEEKTLVRKLNWRVAIPACFMFVALQVDRGNLAQAVADNLLKDMKMTTNDYNVGNQIFYATFLVAEVPSQLISKRLGPDVFIPIQMCAWSIVSMSQGAMNNKAGFYITRALIGLLEGGFIGDLVLWLCYFFTAKELSVRLSWFWTSLSIVQIVTALLAFAILRMRGVCGLFGWQWLFIIEGAFTLLIGLSGFYLMVPSAVQTKNRLHPKGWFTEREEKIVVNRVLRDDPSKGDMSNRQPLGLRQLWSGITDFHLWPIYAVGLIAYIPVGTFTPYLTLNLRQLGFSTFNVQLLTIPYNFIHIILLLSITWFSERINERALLSTLAPIWSTFFLGLIRWWPGAMVKPWPTYALTTLFLGQPYIHAICVSWVSRNSNSIRSRAVSTSLYNMFVQLGSIIANQFYRADDKPLYHRGNMQLFFVSAGTIGLLFVVKWYYMFQNNKREKIWAEMTEEGRTEYVLQTQDSGNRRLDFRFAH